MMIFGRIVLVYVIAMILCCLQGIMYIEILYVILIQIDMIQDAACLYCDVCLLRMMFDIMFKLLNQIACMIVMIRCL